MRKLSLIQILEYYDVPQILTAADVTGTRYLCTLFEKTSEGYDYLGVQISEPRLMAFVGGQLDLRDAYLHPEVDNALYLVEASREQLTAKTLLEPSAVTDSMLPEQGYYYDPSDIQENAESEMDTYQLKVPAHDRATFSTLMSRMGWIASSLKRILERLLLYEVG